MRQALVVITAVALLGIAGLALQPKNNTQAASSTQPATSQTASPPTSATTSSSSYKNGTFTGDTADTPYGPVQIAIIVSGGQISDVKFLQLPSDMGHSREISAAAAPLLKQTTLSAQSSNIDFVSGATSTSYGYQQSLQAALDQAKM